MILRLVLAFFMIGQGTLPSPGPGTVNPHGSNKITYKNSCNSFTTNAASLAVPLNGSGCNNVSYTPAVGDTVVLYLGMTNNSVTGGACPATDPNGNTWSSTLSAGHQQLICISKLTTGGNVTITPTWTGNSAAQSQTWESSGTQNTLDGSIQFSSISSSTTWQMPSLGPTGNANDVVLGFGFESGTSITFTQLNPWNLLNTISGSAGENSVVIYQIVTSTGTYIPEVTVSTAVAGNGTTLALESQ